MIIAKDDNLPQEIQERLGLEQKILARIFVKKILNNIDKKLNIIIN